MQTFLPYADFHRSAKALDSHRLGNQILEGYQILRAISYPSAPWQNHPITKMWLGHGSALMCYIEEMNNEFAFRFNHPHKAYLMARELSFQKGTYPSWLGYSHFHESHRLNLIYKNKNFYIKKFPISGRDYLKVTAKTDWFKPDYLWFNPSSERWYVLDKGKKIYLNKEGE